MQLRFPNPQIRRLVEGNGSFPGIDGDALERFFEVIAVVGAARSIDDFTALRAFSPTRLDGVASRRWAIPIGPTWQVVLAIEGSGSSQTASLQDIQSRPHLRRTK